VSITHFSEFLHLPPHRYAFHQEANRPSMDDRGLCQTHEAVESGINVCPRNLERQYGFDSSRNWASRGAGRGLQLPWARRVQRICHRTQRGGQRLSLWRHSKAKLPISSLRLEATCRHRAGSHGDDKAVARCSNVWKGGAWSPRHPCKTTPQSWSPLLRRRFTGRNRWKPST